MRYRREVHVQGDTFLRLMAEDVRRGLTHTPKSLPPKYFYDARGSALFERITRLPEYYLTRTEHALLQSMAPGLIRHLRPREIVEIGSGASIKMRHLLDACDGEAVRYLPVDVDEHTVERAADELLRAYPVLQVHGIIGDFERHLGRIPPAQGRRLVVFLGSTLGNLDPPARGAVLAEVRRLLAAGDQFLLGVDLVKDTATLEAAYDDRQGVTAEFNRNILHVINRMLQAD
ncbi:MAG TPA: L-histidine N(alpha)-methyltransferase, partial [Candidatus Sulfotelmatobacter sp.]|nr:L-histidine N(alpha)-methyltransferase [Candidatus Sulfotelmatobacter sp.]